MSKLKELIQSLKAKYIVIVENDFGYITDPKEILGHFANSTDNDIDQICAALKEIEQNELAEALEKFRSDFLQIDNHDVDLISQLLPNNIHQYLKDIQQNEILSDTLVSILDESLKNDDDNSLKEIFLRHGILTTTEIYDDILNELKSIPGIRIAYFSSTISPSEMDRFQDQLDSIMEDSDGMFWLAIVDKMLGQGSVDELGIELIDTFLEFDHSFVGFILTSDADDNESEKYSDYFKREISKSDASILETITKRLAEAGYAEVFRSIQKKYLDSSEEALNTVLKNQKNIKHIVAKAHAEGIPAYDAIKYWFELAVQKGVDKLEVEDFKFVGGLTSFFNDSYLGDHPSIHSISNELSALNTYELFDTTLNSKHLAIAPGDIWYANGQYFILMGQLCDLLLRENDNTRNAKLVELLEVQLTHHTEDGKDKFYVEVDSNGTKTIKIENFYDLVSEERKMLKIEVSTPNIFFADPAILDLCMFNDSGDCSIILDNELPSEVVNVIPSSKELYYEKLQEKFKALTEFINDDGRFQGLKSPIEFGDHKVMTNDTGLTFNIRRIGRLKGRYYDSLYNNYQNNKGRIDLNLIENAPETSTDVSIEIGFIGQENFQTIQDVNLWDRKSLKFFKKSELIELGLNEEFRELVNECDKELLLSENQKFQIVQDETGNYRIELRYRVEKKGYSSKTNFGYSDLFHSRRPNENNLYRIGDGEELDLTNEEQGMKKFTIEELKNGVHFFEENTTIIWENGFIKRLTKGVESNE